MRNATLLFLLRKEDGEVKDICLAMKKRGFGKGRYNGVGGKVEEGEHIEDAVKREAKEEIGVDVEDVTKCAELTFTFPHNPLFDQVVHVYLTDSWKGEIVETEEMLPGWKQIDEIPYQEMWPDDVMWLPLVLKGKYVTAAFSFGEGDVIVSHTIEAK